MDIQKIKELALANGFKLKEQASGNMDLNAYVYDFANAVEREAKAKAVPEGRTDFEIISQTIELVDLFAHANRFQRDKSMPFPFESENPRNIEWWRLACQVQELLTDTDPNNCDFEEYKAMIEAQEPTND